MCLLLLHTVVVVPESINLTPLIPHIHPVVKLGSVLVTQGVVPVKMVLPVRVDLLGSSVLVKVSFFGYVGFIIWMLGSFELLNLGTPSFLLCFLILLISLPVSVNKIYSFAYIRICLF